MDQMKNNRVETDFIVKKQLLGIFRVAAFPFVDFIAPETACDRIMPQWVKKNSTSVLEVLLG